MSSNGITVPANFKHMIRRERKTTDDYKPQIRAYINKHAGQVIFGSDFDELLGTTTATAHIHKLMKQGYIIRNRVRKGGGKGIRYTYTWHDIPLDEKTATVKNGGVVTTKLVPDFFLDNKNMSEVDCQFLNWIDDQTDGQQILGAISFRKHLHAKVAEHKELKKTAIANLNKGE